VQETVHLAKSTEEQIRFYLSQRYLSPGARAFMKDLSSLMAQKAALQRQITEWTEQAKRLTDEQGRLRSNIHALVSNVPKEQELRAKWVQALSVNEDQLAKNRASLDEAGGKLRQMDESLAKKVSEYKDE
jgi:predicted  nucleic acid-binding Zn-ribbon protein